MGRVSGRVADQTKGGFLDDTDVKIVGARFEKSEFEGNDGTVKKTQAVISYEVEGREEPIDIFYSVGSQNVLVPGDEDEEEQEVGQFLQGAEGRDVKGVNQNSAWGKFKAQLVAKCKFPDELFDLALEDALVGLEGHLVSIDGGKFRGQEGRPIPVFASIVKDTIPGKGGKKAAGKKSGKVAGKPGKTTKRTDSEDDTESAEDEAPAPKTGKKGSGSQGGGKAAAGKGSKKPVEDEEEAEDGDDDADDDSSDLETRVGEAIVKAVKKGALPKGRLAQAVGKVFEGEDDRPEAVKLTMSDKFLKAGVEEGLWSYEGGKVGPPEEEGEGDDDE